jgi:long-chain acyl-CoA synthetase
MPADTAPAWPIMPISRAHEILTGQGMPFEMENTVIRGVSFRTYKTVPPTLRDMFQLGRMHGDKPYIVFQDERMSFDAHARAATTFAHVLRDVYGVGKGDRVAVIMRNYPQWAVAFWAAQICGAIATPMNSWWTGEELAYGLADSGAKVAVVDPQLFERIRDEWPKLPDLKAIVIARDSEERADPRVTSMEHYVGPCAAWAGLKMPELPAVEIGPDDDATIMYTSGTTGRPKGAVATHRAIISNIFNGLACQARSFLRRGEMPPAPDLSNPRAGLISIPFFHATGAFAMLVPSMLNAQKLVTLYKWDPLDALKLIEHERINTFGGVPAIAWQVLEHPERSKYDLSSVDVISYGGAPSSPELVSTVKRVFPASMPGNGWGMTETCAVATYNFAEDYVNRPDSAGHPAPAVDIKIVGPDGQTLPAGEVGELWCKGPMNCRAYWNKPEATQKTFVDGWVVTGDLARLDEEGFLFIVDRAKDMLIRGGENVYSVEVENVLFMHPAVVDAAVVGIPHKVLGEEVGAVVFLKPGASATEAELQHFCAQKLAAFKVPVQVMLLDTTLPRNATGKVLKTELRKLFTPRG